MAIYWPIDPRHWSYFMSLGTRFPYHMAHPAGLKLGGRGRGRAQIRSDDSATHKSQQ